MAHAVDNMNFESQMEYVNHEDNCGQMKHTDNVDGVCQMEDFQNIDDVYELKRMATYSVYANKIMCRRRINALKSLENHLNFMKYLNKTKAKMIRQHDKKVLVHFHILSKGMLRSIQGLKRLQKVIRMLHESQNFKGKDKEDVVYLHDAFSTVPDDNFNNSSDKLSEIVEKLKNIKDGVLDIKDYNSDLEEVVPAETVQAETNFDKRGKLGSSDMSTHDESLKETHENATKSEKLHKKRGPKKRAKKPGESCMKTDSKSADRSKDTCNDQISHSVDDSFHLKDLVVKVTDFMLDDSANRDPYIAKFKALCQSLVSDDESKAADSDADHDFDENYSIPPPAENDDDEDDDLEKASFTTVESADDDIEEESTASKSTANVYTTVESADDDFEVDSAASPPAVAVCSENAEDMPAPRSPPFSPTHVSGRTRGRGPRTPPEPEPLEI